MKANIVLLPGDGVGPEVVSSTRQVLDAVAKRRGHEFSYSSHSIGGIAIDETGNPLPESTLDAAKKADAILLGAVGGPKWDDPNAKTRPEKGLLAIRQGLGLYANLRPVRSFKELVASSPLKPERIAGCGGLATRHDAMLAGESGADYVMFGEPDRNGRRPGFEAVLERVSWWAETLTIPCVGYAAGLDEVEALARAGADFIAIDEPLWRGGAAALGKVTQRLSVMEPAR